MPRRNERNGIAAIQDRPRQSRPVVAGLYAHRMLGRSSYPSVEWAEVCLWIAEHRPDLDARLGAAQPPALPLDDRKPSR